MYSKCLSPGVCVCVCLAPIADPGVISIVLARTIFVLVFASLYVLLKNSIIPQNSLANNNRCTQYYCVACAMSISLAPNAFDQPDSGLNSTLSMSAQNHFAMQICVCQFSRVLTIPCALFILFYTILMMHMHTRTHTQRPHIAHNCIG